MNLNLTSLCVTGRIFIVVAEEKEEKKEILEEKVPIEKMYEEILKLLDEYYRNG